MATTIACAVCTLHVQVTNYCVLFAFDALCGMGSGKLVWYRAVLYHTLIFGVNTYQCVHMTPQNACTTEFA